MAIVRLQTAKDHLRIPPDDVAHDVDIDAKLEAAIAIILQYLGAQATRIETVSVANPTVITTSTPHGLTTGTTYTIEGTTTTPTVNGVQTVTVTSTTTFTVPVNVTSGQTEAAGTVGLATYTETTLPGAVKSGILITLEDLYERRPINWEALSLLLMRSRDPAVA